MECWVKCYEKCPLCGSIETEYNTMEVLASCPPQYSFRCKCGHHWSGIFKNNLATTPVYDPPKKSGSYGWICPVCGAGVSPYQDHCPCCSGKSLTPTWTCGSGSISSDGSTPQHQLYNSNAESNVGVCAPKVSTTRNKTDAELLIDTANSIKNNIRKQDKNDRSK